MVVPFSYKINYNNVKTELCDIGAKYDTDKSSQRQNITNDRHCHPYTIFYDSIFSGSRNRELRMAELGILDGASMRMWEEYFMRGEIIGFENNEGYINKYLQSSHTDRTTVEKIDVLDSNNIRESFDRVGGLFDIIIDDTTHMIDDQIRIINSVYDRLKPGGFIIIEDIFLHYNESDYLNRLSPVLNNFQNIYFVTMDHIRRNSNGWDNDKLLVLIKDGAAPLFGNNCKITIITPCIRPQNLKYLYNSINFRYVDEWIIVYDGSKINVNPNIFCNTDEKIKELIYSGEGISGNPQRNYALELLDAKKPDTFLYYLDDDNIIHPDFYRLLDIVGENMAYSFDQYNRMCGDVIFMKNIDTAMLLLPYKLCHDIRWTPDIYEADGVYMYTCIHNNIDHWVYINNVLCYYNYCTGNGSDKKYEVPLLSSITILNLINLCKS